MTEVPHDGPRGFPGQSQVDDAAGPDLQLRGAGEVNPQLPERPLDQTGAVEGIGAGATPEVGATGPGLRGPQEVGPGPLGGRCGRGSGEAEHTQASQRGEAEHRG